MIKIIGQNDLIGVYELGKVSSPNGELVDGMSKYEINAGVECAMRYSLISKQLQYVMGEVLTTLEAVIADERQLKATKSIIKAQFSKKLDWVYEQCGSPEEEADFVGMDTE